MFCAIARALRSGGGPRAASRRRPSLVARSMADGPAKLVVDPETGEEMSKNALKKLLKKRDIAARKAASAAEKAAAAAARGGGGATASRGPAARRGGARGLRAPAAGLRFGDYATCQSAVELDGAPRRRALDSPADDVWVRARVANVRAKGNSCFLVLRGLDDALETVQCCYFKNADDGARSKDVLKFLADLTDESVVDTRGALVAADVASCSRSTVEIQLKSLFVVTRAPKVLPFLVEDAARGDLGAVFEVGPVFRAENSNTRRHLCEFTGLDFEMPITSHYLEAVRVGHRTFKAIFEGLERDFSKELAAVRDQYPSEPVVVSDEPVVIHFADAIAMLRDSGVDVEDDYGDLSGADELALGALVKEQHGVDFFVALKAKGIDPGAEDLSPSLKSYMTAFEHGAPPHAGCGFGLERVVFLYLGLDNIRKASLFPRDPKRCAP
ncbi:hypothetical protein JL721_9523 [Aureococcus anophagefferens]|nr:hypothetical protein JL721_9523 [Aureococcus anophagefferens]